jgi:ABC-type transport system substrate-binding protein
MFTSSTITTAKNPDHHTFPNFTGFADPVVDRLVAAATSTYDQAERASLYRQMQEELAAQLPYIFLWGATAYDLVRSPVTTVDGPLDLTMPNWGRQPERLVVAAATP